jgi:hypothetical protein
MLIKGRNQFQDHIYEKLHWIACPEVNCNLMRPLIYQEREPICTLCLQRPYPFSRFFCDLFIDSTVKDVDSLCMSGNTIVVSYNPNKLFFLVNPNKFCTKVQTVWHIKCIWSQLSVGKHILSLFLLDTYPFIWFFSLTY